MIRLMLVEDDKSLGDSIKYTLSKEGFFIQSGDSIAASLELLKSYTPDLILLDVMLPDGSGFDFLSKIKETSDIPVIFLTACDEEVSIVRGLEMGGDDYITKPFRLRELIARIHGALRKSTAKSSDNTAIINAGDISLNTLERKLIKSGREIPLTPTEFKILHIFMQNPNRCFSRELILQKLWETEADFAEDNALSVYVRRLREKIEDDPGEPQYIVTVWGHGYKWTGVGGAIYDNV